jgi:hypothetical protein
MDEEQAMQETQMFGKVQGVHQHELKNLPFLMIDPHHALKQFWDVSIMAIVLF